MRVTQLCQNFHFWVNYPFKLRQTVTKDAFIPRFIPRSSHMRAQHWCCKMTQAVLLMAVCISVSVYQWKHLCQLLSPSPDVMTMTGTLLLFCIRYSRNSWAAPIYLSLSLFCMDTLLLCLGQSCIISVFLSVILCTFFLLLSISHH